MDLNEVLAVVEDGQLVAGMVICRANNANLHIGTLTDDGDLKLNEAGEKHLEALKTAAQAQPTAEVEPVPAAKPEPDSATADAASVDAGELDKLLG